MTFEDEIRSEAEKLALELIEKWKTGYDDSTNMRTLLYRYLEKAILVGAAMVATKDMKTEHWPDGCFSVKLSEKEAVK